jgi:hypothetical protein
MIGLLTLVEGEVRSGQASQLTGRLSTRLARDDQLADIDEQGLLRALPTWTSSFGRPRESTTDAIEHVVGAREVLPAVEISGWLRGPRLDALVGAWQSRAATAPTSPGG